MVAYFFSIWLPINSIMVHKVIVKSQLMIQVRTWHRLPLYIVIRMIYCKLTIFKDGDNLLMDQYVFNMASDKRIQILLKRSHNS